MKENGPDETGNGRDSRETEKTKDQPKFSGRNRKCSDCTRNIMNPVHGHFDFDSNANLDGILL